MISVIGLVIGVIVLIAGLYYLTQAKDPGKFIRSSV